jgi:hypothetical protein
MTATITIPVGRAFDMEEDVEYAVPSGNWNFRTVGSGTLELSIDKTTWATATADVPFTALWARAHSDTLSIVINHA